MAGMNRRVRKKPAPRTYAEAARVYGIPLKAIYKMIDLRVLDPTFTPQSHMRLEDVIWQLWGRWPLIKAQMSTMKASDKKRLLESPYGMKVHEDYAYKRYREHFRKGNLTELTLDRVIGEIASYKRVYEPTKAAERWVYRSDIKKARRRAYAFVDRENKKKNLKTKDREQ
jgi:hypothetical protein